MEQVLNIATAVRSHFVDRLVTSLKEFQSTHSPSAPEVLLELQREEAYPFRLYRVDMISNAGGESKIQEVNPDSYLNFESFTVTASSSLQISFQPIAWYGVDFKCNANSFNSELEVWTLRWLDVEDKHELDANGLQGVIHSVTAPRTNGTYFEFSVDFGSSPVEAMMELFAVLSSAGATKIEVSSSCIG